MGQRDINWIRVSREAGEKGFISHSWQFILPEGGAARIVWMNVQLKEEMKPMMQRIGKEAGIEDLCGRIDDETVATTEEEVLEYIPRMEHPAFAMPPLF